MRWREIKYSFLVPYHDRAKQFYEALRSWSAWYKDRGDVQLVVVLDQKSKEQYNQVWDLLYDSGFPFLLLEAEQNGFNPAPHYNQAAVLADGRFFVLTSPEIRHDADILAGADQVVETGNTYLVCACESVQGDGSHHMWYQHSQHRAANYHFCSVIRAKDYWRAGGFDSRFAEGVSYDDDDFLRAVTELGLDIVQRDDLKTTHLWHSKPYERMPMRRQLVEKNRLLFEAKWAGR